MSSTQVYLTLESGSSECICQNKNYLPQKKHIGYSYP
jgi:hypothetical protein